MTAAAIGTWSTGDKASEAIRRSLRYMPASVAGQVEAFLTPTNLSIIGATLAIWGRLALLRRW